MPYRLFENALNEVLRQGGDPIALHVTWEQRGAYLATLHPLVTYPADRPHGSTYPFIAADGTRRDLPIITIRDAPAGAVVCKDGRRFAITAVPPFARQVDP